MRDDSKNISNQLGKSDIRKLDEYFTAIRDIELRIERSEKLPAIKVPDTQAPKGIPAVFEEHIRLMCDLIVLAFQADITRVATFVLANEGSNKPYPFIKVPEGHHDLSHHGNDQSKKEKIKQINLFHVSQLAYLLEKLKATKEGDGNLLDHSILLAGGGCGTLSSGRHLRFPKETPLNNLWLSMLNRMDINIDRLGDSTSALANLK